MDDALADMLSSAAEVADNFLACAPTDRPIRTDELKQVVDFATFMVMTDARAAWAKTHFPAAIDLMAEPVERRFRQAFSDRLYARAPLQQINDEGRA